MSAGDMEYGPGLLLVWFDALRCTVHTAMVSRSHVCMKALPVLHTDPSFSK